MEEISLLNTLLAHAHGGSIFFNVKKTKMRDNNKRLQLILKQNIFKTLILICIVFASSINLIGQNRVNFDLTYDKTGQLILEDMSEYFWTQFMYDKDGNRTRKYTYSQIIGGVEDKENTNINNISVFPVPASNFITVELTLQKADFVSFSIISVDGKKHYSENKHMEVGENSHKINLSNLPNGSYVLELIYNDRKYSSVIVIN